MENSSSNWPNLAGTSEFELTEGKCVRAGRAPAQGHLRAWLSGSPGLSGLEAYKQMSITLPGRQSKKVAELDRN
jgi:hypothetical protein